MIVVTGGYGFIGNNLVRKLRKLGYFVVVLDTIESSLMDIYSWLHQYQKEIDVIFHLGAITDTTLDEKSTMYEYNFNFSIFVWGICVKNNIPLIYASSAATYGNGEYGFEDDDPLLKFEPLNVYGRSKNDFDEYVRKEKFKPPFWYGLKFFNVYGHDEGHKGKMASVMFQFYNQIMKTGGVKLFRSHIPECEDGEQMRDFIYVDDIVDVCVHMMIETPFSGIYNVGTGKARSYNDVAIAVFDSLGKDVNISYIDTPEEIRENYQYFTEANMRKLRLLGGYKKDFHELEEGVQKYINILQNENCEHYL